MELTRAQLECLVSPLRKRILQEVVAAERTTATQLAPRVGVPLKRLYHHLNQMVGVGLLNVVETVQGRGKPERHYSPADTRFTLPEDPASRSLVADEVAATLRLAEKEHRQALLTNDGPLDILRTVVRLTPEEAEELGEAIRAALQRAKSRSSPEKPLQLAVTTLIAPTIK